MAEKADLDQTFISGIERGARNPTIITNKLSKMLRTDYLRCSSSYRVTLETLVAFVDKMDAEVAFYHPNEEWVFSNGRSVFICTEGAKTVVEACGGFVVGYRREDNPTAIIPDPSTADGHDFAFVANRYIVDPWATYVAGIIPCPVLDLQKPTDCATVLRLYGRPNAWNRIDALNHEQKPKLDPRAAYIGIQAL